MTIKSSATQISSIGIVGAGNMGSSIAVSLSELGIPIKLIDNSATALENGLKRIEKLWTSLEQKAQKNNATESKSSQQRLDIAARRLLIQPIQTYDGLANVDLIIEAVNEDIEIKKTIFQTLDNICQPKTIFASNTSSFSITQLASFTKRQGRVIGMHFFNPAHIMSLVEVIPGLNTDPQVTHAVIELVRRLGKLPIKVEECASFLVNRLLSRYLNEAIWILQTNIADIKTIDEAACQMLMPIGPLKLRDMNGLDIGLGVARFNYNEYGDRFQPPPLLEALVEKNILGQKTQAGFYLYKENERKSDTVNPSVDQIIASINSLPTSKNISPDLPPFEPMQLFLPMINEAFLILQEKIVDAKDIDPALKAGLGMRQGLLEYAFEFGLEKCLMKIENLNRVYGERFRPAPLLKRYVWSGKHSL